MCIDNVIHPFAYIPFFTLGLTAPTCPSTTIKRRQHLDAGSCRRAGVVYAPFLSGSVVPPRIGLWYVNELDPSDEVGS